MEGNLVAGLPQSPFWNGMSLEPTLTVSVREKEARGAGSAASKCSVGCVGWLQTELWPSSKSVGMPVMSTLCFCLLFSARVATPNNACRGHNRSKK